MKKLFNIGLMLLILSGSIIPQEINGQNNSAVLSILPNYQTWNGISNSVIRQYSNRVFLNYFVNRDIRLSLQSGYASSEAMQNKISGLSDAQVSINYKLRKLNTALDFGINLPTGQEKVNLFNFQSSILLCSEIFNMKMPLLRQGTNIFAGVTWAKDISDAIIVGLGVSYQFKGKYSPVSDNSLSYKPSNELLISGGLDFRLNESATVSGDAIAIIYGNDKINGINSFSAGTKTIYSLMFRQYYGYNNLLVFLRYRNCAIDKLNGISEFIYSEKISPNNLMALVNFKHQISGYLSLNYLAEGRFYQKTVAPFSGYNIFGAGITFNIKILSNLFLPFTAKYFRGNSDGSVSINGMELGTGIILTL